MKNKRGQSLPLVLVVVVIFTVLGPVIYSLVESSIEQYGRRYRARQTQQFIDALKMKMMDPFLCSPILRGQVMSLAGYPTFPLAPQNIQLNFGNGVVVQQGSFLPNSTVQADFVQLQIKSQARDFPTGVRQIKYDWPLAPAANVYDKYYADVLIVPKNTNWNINLNGHKFEIAVIIDPTTHRVHQCHARPSPAEGCEAAGGAFDATGRSPPGLECNPNIICFTHPVPGIPSGTVNNPANCVGLYKGPFQNQVTGLYKAVPMGFTNPMTPSYLCMWCNRWPK